MQEEAGPFLSSREIEDSNDDCGYVMVQSDDWMECKENWNF